MPKNPDSTRWSYSVQFSGLHFPIDMLRSDNAWPATAVDAGKIAASFSDTRLVKPTDAEKLVNLVCAGDPPNSERWRSFMCKLGDVSQW